MAKARLPGRLGRINQSLEDRPVHSLVDRVQVPEEVPSPARRITKRVLIALGALFVAVTLFLPKGVLGLLPRREPPAQLPNGVKSAAAAQPAAAE